MGRGSIASVRKFEDLPQNAQNYVKFNARVPSSS
ncbi:Adenylosuccinate synthetase, partial [Orchesella cincta]